MAAPPRRSLHVHEQLYFRGKLAYASRFGHAFATSRSFSADVLIRVDDLRKMAEVRSMKRCGIPRTLMRDAAALRVASRRTCVFLLGSVATDKYVGPL
jgi:hypothetical protein